MRVKKMRKSSLILVAMVGIFLCFLLTACRKTEKTVYQADVSPYLILMQEGEVVKYYQYSWQKDWWNIVDTETGVVSTIGETEATEYDESKTMFDYVRCASLLTDVYEWSGVATYATEGETTIELKTGFISETSGGLNSDDIIEYPYDKIEVYAWSDAYWRGETEKAPEQGVKVKEKNGKITVEPGYVYEVQLTWEESKYTNYFGKVMYFFWVSKPHYISYDEGESLYAPPLLTLEAEEKEQQIRFSACSWGYTNILTGEGHTYYPFDNNWREVQTEGDEIDTVSLNKAQTVSWKYMLGEEEIEPLPITVKVMEDDYWSGETKEKPTRYVKEYVSTDGTIFLEPGYVYEIHAEWTNYHRNYAGDSLTVFWVPEE